MTLPHESAIAIQVCATRVRAHWKAFCSKAFTFRSWACGDDRTAAGESCVTIIPGWMFLISGIGGLIASMGAGKCRVSEWSLISGLWRCWAGGILLARPIQGVLTLTIVVGAYFLARRRHHHMYALQTARIVGALVVMLVAGAWISSSPLVIAGCRVRPEWAIASWRINLLFGGATLIGMALAAASAERGEIATRRFRG